jgi:Porphobilinogen deaminase, dipyromethane cofactor binding domain
MTSTRKTLVLGTRKSQLALKQTEIVRQKLLQLYPDMEFVLKEMDTVGDKILDVPLSQVGDKGLFTKVCLDSSNKRCPLITQSAGSGLIAFPQTTSD